MGGPKGKTEEAERGPKRQHAPPSGAAARAVVPRKKVWGAPAVARYRRKWRKMYEGARGGASAGGGQREAACGEGGGGTAIDEAPLPSTAAVGERKAQMRHRRE